MDSPVSCSVCKQQFIGRLQLQINYILKFRPNWNAQIDHRVREK